MLVRCHDTFRSGHSNQYCRNTILPPSANLKANAFFPDFATGGTFIARAGATNYNRLQLNAEHRFSHGFSLLANFTCSKCLGDTRDLLDNGVGSYRAPYVPGMGIGADYGLCDINAKRIWCMQAEPISFPSAKMSGGYIRERRLDCWRMVLQWHSYRARTGSR